jgi:hypothetical protein
MSIQTDDFMFPDTPPRKRKAKVSVENTSASAADKSSSAEYTPISASAADKSSSVEDMPTPPLGIRLSEAVDQRLLQFSSSRIPEKEHSAVEGDKGPGNESGNTPLSATESGKASGVEGKARSSKASLLGPWGDVPDEEDSLPPPRSDDEDSASSATKGLDPNHFGLTPMSSNLFKPGHISEVGYPGSTALPTNPFKDGREWAFVSERHKFKSRNLSPKNDGEEAALA